MKMSSFFSVFFVPGTLPPHPGSHISHSATNAPHPAINIPHPSVNVPHPSINAPHRTPQSTPHTLHTTPHTPQKRFAPRISEKLFTYNTYGQVIKEATRTTAETNTLTYYIVTNKKDIADSGIIPCGISDHDLVYIIRHAKRPKIKRDPKIVTVRSTKNLNNDTLIQDLNELPFELIRASADNPLVKL